MNNQTLFYLIVYDLPDNKAANKRRKRLPTAQKNLDKRRLSFYDVNKRIFDGRKRGRKPRSAVKTLGTLTIKDFSRFLERAKKAKSPFGSLDFVSRQKWLWESRLERVSSGGVSL
ncbi:MAG: hypothetical protein RLP02_36960 [Coleofasciculus sp. C2-GNP5-27]